MIHADRDELPSKATKTKSAILTKADLIEEVSRVIEVTGNEAAVLVERMLESMVRAIRAGDKVEIRGFGSFHTRQRRARIGRNPKTGARVEVPPKIIPYFKPGKELRELVAGSSPGKNKSRAL